MPTQDFAPSVLMQYETPLPTTFDLAAVRQRIARVATPFDTMRGLWFKLYVLNDQADSPLNEYSSIYLWEDEPTMRKFLLSDLFQNYTEAFARPIVRRWLTVDVNGELSRLVGARFALRRIFGMPRQTPAAQFVNSWVTRGVLAGSLFRVVSFDPGAWELNDLTIWEDQPPTASDGRLYTLRHVSLPTISP